jgi:periplasmic divalent cation tolerance protein
MIFILVTCAGRDEAQTIAAALVDERLAACVHIMPAHTSLYRWQGKVEQAEEVNILVKTRAERFESVRERVVALHSYDVPCIVSWVADNGHAPYLAWLAEQTA